MKFSLTSLLASTFTLLLFPSFAQHDCGSDGIHLNKFVSNPLYRKAHKKMESETYDRIVKLSEDRRKGLVPKGLTGTVHTIPVVFHIVHFSGTAVGVDENLASSRIDTEIDNLNDLFRNISVYDPLTGADVEIEFALAVRDPNGSTTGGITRTASNDYTDLDKDTEDDALKALSIWDPTKYMNVWVVDEICKSSTGSCSVAGYAYFPSSHGQAWDGIVIEEEFVGTSTSNSKILGHEVGHYLNLSHTFSGGCTNDDCQTDGDKVCDTPPDNSTESVSCASGDSANTCTTDEDDTSVNNPFRPIAQGGLGDQNDMYENYMDYGYQSCQDRFTQGQVDRMRTALEGTRASLLTSDALTPAAVPVSDFSADITSGCEGSSVTFTDESVNGTTEWSWTFTGGSPSSSIVQNPVVTYSSAGVYAVTLTASNSVGAGNAETKTGYITIYSTPAATCVVNTDSLSNNFGMGVKQTVFGGDLLDYSSDGAVAEGGPMDLVCSQVAHAEVNNNYSIYVRTGSANNEDVKVWIDFNNNGTFDEPSELVYQDNVTVSTPKDADHSGTIAIPSDAVTGEILRMRVQSDFYSRTLTNCGNVRYGQVEDYGLVLSDPALTQLASSYCSGNFGNLNVGEVYCDLISGADNYDFNFTDGGAFDQTVRSGKFGRLKLKDVPGLTLNSAYSVIVRPVTGGSPGNYGSTCNITTNVTTQVQSPYCDIAVTSYNTEIYCNLVASATNYSYKFVSQTDASEYFGEIGQYGRLKLNQVVGLPSGHTYDVSVAPRIGGVLGSYGTSCEITTLLPGTQVGTAYCGQTYNSSGQAIYCDLISSATNYEYRLINQSTLQEFTREIGKYGRLKFNQISGFVWNATYDVDVRPRIGGVLGTYGTSCAITVGVPTREGFEIGTEAVTVHPMPFEGMAEVHLEGSGDVLFDVVVTDLTGLRVESFEMSAGSSFQIGQDLARGMYMLTVTSNNEVIHNQKIVKQ